MGANHPSSSIRRERERRLGISVFACCVVSACAVYEPTMMTGDGQSSLADGGEQQGGDSTAGGGKPMQSGGSGSAGSRAMAGSAGAIAGVGGKGGSNSDGGKAGSSGASAGSAGGGNAGSEGNAGSGGNAGNGGSSGNAGTGGGSTVELAQGKATTASTQQNENPTSSANDGMPTTRWAASSSALPQWWRVDLGSQRTLQSYTLTFQHPDREYSYAIETSIDGSAFANPQSRSGKGPQSGTFPGTQARYVQITVTATNPVSYASLFEVSITGQ